MVAVLIVIFFFFLIDIFDGKFGSTIIVICGGAFLLFGIWLREYYRRPKKIKIEKDGLGLIFRYKHPEFIPWQNVKWLLAPPDNPDKLKEAWDRDGYLHLVNNRFFPLYWPVAIAVREAYREQNGRYPPLNQKEADAWK